MKSNAAPVRDVTEATFKEAVIDRSREVPVVVDFWAPWCGPCRMLGPVLEKLAAENAGSFELVKLNTDEAPALSAQFRIRSIPAVMAFKDGKVVDQFIGALPESQVRQWLQAVMPNEADLMAAEGEEFRLGGHLNAAEGMYRRALAVDPNHEKALTGLARVLVQQNEQDEARRLLQRIPGNAEAVRLLSELAVKANAGADIDGLRRRVQANPRDPAAAYELGAAYAAHGNYQTALENLIASIRIDRHWNDDAARLKMLQIFQVLGEGHPLTSTYRRRLSALVF